MNLVKMELILRERDHMKFLLGIETVHVINDGGLGIQYNAGKDRENVQWQPRGTVRPVLSLDVSLST